jgi:hypothetical protein
MITFTGNTDSTAARAGALHQLLTALDRIGLADHLAEARELLTRSHTMRGEPRTRSEQARAERQAIPVKIADGELTIDQAAAHAAALAPWLDGTAAKLAEQAADEIARRAVAVASANTTLPPVLVGRAAAAVDRAAAATEKLLAPLHTLDALYDAMLAHVRNGAPRPAPLGLTVAELRPDQMRYWAEASAAADDFRELHNAWRGHRGLNLLPVRSGVFARPGDRDRMSLLGQLPEPLQLGVAALSGWEPGILDHPGKRPADNEEGILDRIMHAITGRSRVPANR